MTKENIQLTEKYNIEESLPHVTNTLGTWEKKSRIINVSKLFWERRRDLMG